MKTSSALLLAAGTLVAGVAVALIISYDSSCEPSVPYVLELNGAEFASPTTANETAFIAAIKTKSPNEKALFRHGLTKKEPSTPSPIIPPGYKDDGLTPGCKQMRAKAGGLHVTQRIGYDNQKNLKEALSHLKK